MTGRIKKLVSEKMYGFIRSDKGIDHFFHKQDFDGNWNELVEEHEAGVDIELEFEVSRTDKGLRATEVTRKDR